MKLRWRKVFDGCWHGFAEGNPNAVAEVEQFPYGRKLWSAEICGYGRLTWGSYGLFTFREAKALCERRLPEFYPAVTTKESHPCD